MWKNTPEYHGFPVFEFAELTVSHGQFCRLFSSLFVLPVFAGNSFPGDPRTTVDYCAKHIRIGECVSSFVHRTVCFCRTSGEFSCGIWRVRFVHLGLAFQRFVTL